MPELSYERLTSAFTYHRIVSRRRSDETLAARYCTEADCTEFHKTPTRSRHRSSNSIAGFLRTTFIHQSRNSFSPRVGGLTETSHLNFYSVSARYLRSAQSRL